MKENKTKRLLDFTDEDLRDYVNGKGYFTDKDSYHRNIETYFDYINLPSDAKADTLIALYAVRNNSFNLEFVPEELRNDSAFLSSCLKHNINSFQRMTTNELQKKGVLAFVSVTMPKLFEYYPSELKKDPKFWSGIVSINKDFIKELPPEIVQKIYDFRNSKKPVQANEQVQDEAAQVFQMKKKGAN